LNSWNGDEKRGIRSSLIRGKDSNAAGWVKGAGKLENLAVTTGKKTDWANLPIQDKKIKRGEGASDVTSQT